LGTGGRLLRKVRAGVTDRPTGFIWVESGALAASGYPASRNQVRWVASRGVNRLLTLTEEPLPSEWVSGLALDVKHVPMRDHQPPSAASLLEASSYIEDSISNGKVVLVHCLAGQGRTMCAIAAYLIRKGMGVDQSISFLRRLRPGAVESKQEASLHQFASQVGKTTQ
jgi:atypical dual specificity phosphatase